MKIQFLLLFKNIKAFFPRNGDETESAVYQSYKTNDPAFISLKSDATIGKNW